MTCDSLKVTRLPKHDENQKSTSGNPKSPTGYWRASAEPKYKSEYRQFPIQEKT